MATNKEVLAHLQGLRGSVSDAITTVMEYENFGPLMTAGSKTAELAKITTVPAALQHASNCAICNGWDGSAE